MSVIPVVESLAIWISVSVFDRKIAAFWYNGVEPVGGTDRTSTYFVFGICDKDADCAMAVK